ncbi:hypothetical protein ABBQ38_014864 [Trebouxia sp. C0009 RCD-2024]
MAELSCLTNLRMVLACATRSEFDLGWVSSLTKMKQLRLDVKGVYKVSVDWSRLAELTNLQLSAASDGASSSSYSVDWGAMQKLRHLELKGPMHFESCILQLTTIKHLQCVKFSDHTCIGASSASDLARLTHQLLEKRPHVQLYVSGSHAG